MDFFNSLVSKPEMEIIIDEIQGRKKSTFKRKNDEKIKMPTFHDRETISGKVIVNLNKLKKFEHTGIRIQLVGCIEHFQDKKNSSKFITLNRDLEPPGIINNDITQIPFKFNNVDMQYETYYGLNMRVYYYLEVIMTASVRNILAEQEFGVINEEDSPITTLDKIKLEVGIDDWLHLVFEVERNKYHLKDVIDGFVRFKKVSIKLVSMELQLIRKETMLANTNSKPETEVITRFEIMDGGPTKNETIPIKWFLSPYELTPTYSNVGNRLSVQYYINLVLIDVEERKYFKQHEVTFLRLDKKSQSAMEGLREERKKEKEIKEKEKQQKKEEEKLEKERQKEKEISENLISNTN